MVSNFSAPPSLCRILLLLNEFRMSLMPGIHLPWGSSPTTRQNQLKNGSWIIPEIRDKRRNLGNAISVRTSHFVAGILVTVDLNKGKVTRNWNLTLKTWNSSVRNSTSSTSWGVDLASEISNVLTSNYTATFVKNFRYCKPETEDETGEASNLLLIFLFTWNMNHWNKS